VTPTERRRLITDVCDLAAQLRPEDRDRFVEGQCQGDHQLLEEVKSALSELPSGEITGGTASASNGSPPTIKRIGRYEITGIIGSGGSGHVYSALDRTVGRVVAIKMLNTPDEADLVRRFRDEAKTVANLHHKNIVTVHEYGEEEGVPYLVMEYLNGTTLQSLIGQGTLSLLEKVEIMSEVAEGLQYAHEHRITHRDIKPANIMRLTDGSVKIMDFGIARLAAPNTTKLTQSGLLIGSLMYMAPEQFGGTADPLTDVFGYGVTFYELLTGKNPFFSTDPVVIIFKISNTDPPPVRSVAPECPEALDRIVGRAISRDREARYTSLSDVLADTRGILSDLRHSQAARFYAEAEQCFAAGQLDEAKSAVRKALKLDPVQEEARTLRSEIEEALRRRDWAARAQALIDQAEKAVGGQRWDEAAGALDSIRELGVGNPQLQGRLEWAAAQVEMARRRERLLNEAQRNLEKENLTASFRAVSEVLAADPGNQPGKELLQEIRNQMVARETKRRLEQEAARALAQDAQAPDAQAPERPAPGRMEQIAQLKSEAEALIARNQCDRAAQLLEAAITELGDDWDLTRLLLQARTAANAQNEQAEVEEPEPAVPLETLQEDAGERAAAQKWLDTLGKVDETPGQPGEHTQAGLPQAPRVGETEPADRPAPPRGRRKRSVAVWIGAGAIAVSVGILLIVVAGSRWGRPRVPDAPMLSVDVPPGSSAAVRGNPFSLDLRASGASSPISWDVRDGALPPGLSLSPGTGRIEGTPVTTGVYIFFARAADRAGHTAVRAITLEVVAPHDEATAAPESPGATSAEDSGKPAAGTTPREPVGAKTSDAKNVGTAANSRVEPGTGAGSSRAKGDSKTAGSNPAATAANSRVDAPSTGPMWAADGGDARRSGYAPYLGPRKPRIAWSVEAGNRDQNSPLVGPDGRVYVWNAREHVLKCVENAAVIWSVPLTLNDQVSFGPDGAVQLSSFVGRTRTLDRDGTGIRSVPSDMRFLGLYQWRGHAYNSSGIAPRDSQSTRWFFFRADDRAWQVELDDQASRPVVGESGVMYVGTNKGTLYAVSDAATFLWSFITGAGATHGLAVTRDRDILAAIGQSLFAVRDGQLRWKFQGEGDGNSSPPIHDQAGTIYFGKGTDFYALTASGKELWRLKLPEAVSTAPAMDRSGRIYVASATRLYCISD
jgi:serine/threonine-protein kinase